MCKALYNESKHLRMAAELKYCVFGVMPQESKNSQAHNMFAKNTRIPIYTAAWPAGKFSLYHIVCAYMICCISLCCRSSKRVALITSICYPCKFIYLHLSFKYI